MTFEQIIVKYIYQHKQLTLQNFGTVALNNAVPDYDLVHKNKHIAVEGAVFTFNPKALTEENFAAFFAQQRGKIKPLAVSDIESHLQLARQLMNIGKPWEIDGLGMFVLQKDGSVSLVPGNYVVPPLDGHGQHSKLRERTEVEEKIEAEATAEGMRSGTKKALLAVAIIIALAIAGWFIWSNYGGNEPVAESQVEEAPVAVDTVPAYTPVPVPDSSQFSVANSATDTILWRAYFRSFAGKENVASMIRNYSRLRTVMASTTDSVNFRLYTLVKSPVSDTTAKIDSLKTVFLRPVTLERDSSSVQ